MVASTMQPAVADRVVRAARFRLFSAVFVHALASGACGGDARDDDAVLTGGAVVVRSRGDVEVAVRAEDGPKLGANVFVVTFPSRDDVAVVSAAALMPAHGHGSKPPVVTADGDAYRVRDLLLYMSGRWEVRLSLRAGAREDEALFVVDVP